MYERQKSSFKGKFSMDLEFHGYIFFPLSYETAIDSVCFRMTSIEVTEQ